MMPLYSAVSRWGQSVGKDKARLYSVSHCDPVIVLSDVIVPPHAGDNDVRVWIETMKGINR